MAVWEQQRDFFWRFPRSWSNTGRVPIHGDGTSHARAPPYIPIALDGSTQHSPPLAWFDMLVDKCVTFTKRAESVPGNFRCKDDSSAAAIC